MLLAIAIVLFSSQPSWASSYFTQRLEDPKAIYITGPSGTNDTMALQQAIDQVQQATGQGIVFLPEGHYRITDTLHVWPGIRLIGYGASRPVIILPASTAGFQDAAHDRLPPSPDHGFVGPAGVTRLRGAA
jgi:hypothetical protein